MRLSTLDQMKTLDSDLTVELTDEQLKRLQGILLEMADDIIGFCEENSLRYNLGGGSALGAVRHHGFIPWDDDMDLDMPRADYEQFIREFPKKFPEKYTVDIPGITPDYILSLAQVRKRGTTLRAHDNTTGHDGVTVDINIQENTYNNPALRFMHGAVSMALGLICSCRRFYHQRELYDALSAGNEGFSRVVRVKVALGRLVSFRSLKAWAETMGGWHSRCKDSHSKYVVVPSGRKHFFGEIYERSLFGDGCPMPFEGRMWKVPARWGEYLTMHYGEYMQIPKDADKERHAYLAIDLGEETGDALDDTAPLTSRSEGADGSMEAQEQ